MVTIVGGKRTTYRRMAQDTVDVLSKRDGSALAHPTQQLPLYGSAGWPTAQRDLKTRGDALGLSPATQDHLGSNYGSEALNILKLIEEEPDLAQSLVDDLPYIRAEVIHACRAAMAITPYDVLGRRTSLTLEDRQRGLGIVEEVAAMMAKELDWSPEQQQQMASDYRTAIEAQMAAEK